MSADYPDRSVWLAIRTTPHGQNFHKRRPVRYLHAGGTFVRLTGNGAKDAKLSAFQRQCNGNFQEKRRG